MLATALWADLGNTIADEKKMRLIKNHRKELLSACDWTQLPDAPLTDAERVTWQQYRQALRDLPQTYPNPSDVMFPEQP